VLDAILKAHERDESIEAAIAAVTTWEALLPTPNFSAVIPNRHVDVLSELRREHYVSRQSGLGSQRRHLPEARASARLAPSSSERHLSPETVEQSDSPDARIEGIRTCAPMYGRSLASSNEASDGAPWSTSTAQLCRRRAGTVLRRRRRRFSIDRMRYRSATDDRGALAGRNKCALLGSSHRVQKRMLAVCRLP